MGPFSGIHSTRIINMYMRLEVCFPIDAYVTGTRFIEVCEYSKKSSGSTLIKIFWDVELGE